MNPKFFPKFAALMRPSKRKSMQPQGDSTDGRKTSGNRVSVTQPIDRARYETNRDLVGRAKFRTYHQIERRVPVVGAYCSLVRGASAKAKFTFDGDDDRAMDLLTGILPTQWAQHKTDMVEALLYGFSVNEWATSMVNGAYRLRSIRRIPQSSLNNVFVLDRDDNVDLFVQYSRTKREIRRWQTFYVVSGRGYQGDGMLSNVAETAIKYVNLSDRLYAAMDANLRGVPNFKVPNDDIQAESEVYKLVKDIQDNAQTTTNPRVILPSDVFEAVGAADTKPTGNAPMTEIIDAFIDVENNDRLMQTEREIALSLNCQSLLLGADGAGSLALAREQMHTLYDRTDSGLEAAAEEVERVLGLLYAWNGYGQAPQVSVDTSAWTNAKDMADGLMNIANVDRAIYKEAVDYVLERYGMPVPEDEPERTPAPATEEDMDEDED